MLAYSAPQSIERIPIIDLGGAGSTATCTKTAEQIHEACRDIGFFYVTNHRVPETLLTKQLAWAARFFALPADAKLALSGERSPRRLGYEPMLRQVLDEGSAPDLKESFMYSLPQSAWPSALPGFAEQMALYQQHMRELGRQLMQLIAMSLDLPRDHFDVAFADAAYAVRLLRYPPQVAVGPSNQLGAGAHTDWGAITLLLQDDAGGLEVRNASGRWLRAAPMPNSFVINLGDLMRRWTNDLYQSTPHRVLNNLSGRDRYSVATFCSPGYDCLVDCLPTCLPAGQRRRYEACTVGEHMREMAERTYAANHGPASTSPAPT
jgi:isopenicillin N synthase-like dioxygenase